MTPGPGHNGGPSLDNGTAWRTHCWRQARESLLPTLPIEVVRLRVARASTGQDVIGFLFSSNALRLLRASDRLSPDWQARLATLVRSERIGMAQPPRTPASLLDAAPLDAACSAPPSTLSWTELRDHLRAILRDRRHPGDGYVLVGETALEREWVEAGRLAGFLTGDAYFGAAA